MIELIVKILTLLLPVLNKAKVTATQVQDVDDMKQALDAHTRKYTREEIKNLSAIFDDIDSPN